MRRWIILAVGIGFGVLAIENGLYVPAALLLVGVLMAWWAEGRETEMEAQEIKAQYLVPHCKFEKTLDGFIVSFKQISLSVHRMADGGGPGAILGLVCLIFGGIKATKIEVTKDWVIIDEAKLKRTDFGQFCINHTLKIKGNENTLAQLGYHYGNRKFGFGGGWDEGQAAEVASALNLHLAAVPTGEARVSAERLRAVQPAEF
jgi:hypothetical protein